MIQVCKKLLDFLMQWETLNPRTFSTVASCKSTYFTSACVVSFCCASVLFFSSAFCSPSLLACWLLFVNFDLLLYAGLVFLVVLQHSFEMFCRNQLLPYNMTTVRLWDYVLSPFLLIYSHSKNIFNRNLVAVIHKHKWKETVLYFLRVSITDPPAHFWWDYSQQ